jgi:hypothetical protein
VERGGQGAVPTPYTAPHVQKPLAVSLTNPRPWWVGAGQVALEALGSLQRLDRGDLRYCRCPVCKSSRAFCLANAGKPVALPLLTDVIGREAPAVV